MTPLKRGCLLVAAPTLDDPNFYRSVVLVLAYDEEGALGVVLNRPGNTLVAEIVPSWALHASSPRVLFSGGPVQPNAAICVGHHVDIVLDGHRGEVGCSGGSAVEDDDANNPRGYSPLTLSIGTVDLHREPEDIAVTFAGVRVFKGYAGWGAGQLDEEVAQKAWYVVDGTPADILTPDPDGLWERVLRSQGGWLSVLARHPVDPSLN
ncbi:MAG: YqgE/AlgH family protein [Acidimicrobiales bacterium]